MSRAKVKLCLDCKWCRGFIGTTLAECETPRLPRRINPCTGESIPVNNYLRWADHHRREGVFEALINGSCGKAGRFFEPK